MFTEDGHYSQVEKVTVEDKEVTEVAQMVGLDVPKAILLNCDDYGFAVFIQNSETTSYFENHLGQVKDQLNRGTIISQLIVMMREIMYPANRFPKILNQMINEGNQNLINMVALALQSARSTYLPTETVPEFNKDVAKFFFEKAAQE